MSEFNKAFLIRHGQSKFNVSENAALEKGLSVYEYKFNETLVDAGISKLGRLQAEQAGKSLVQENIKIVFTSPLRRCMETTRYIFKDHPSKPRVIVLPILREIFSSACDVSDDIKELKLEFSEYDFSLIEELSIEEHWLIHSLQNETLRNEFMTEIMDIGLKDSDKKLGLLVKEFLLKKLREHYPAQFETSFDMIERNIKAKEVFKKFMEELDPNEKVAVVAHYYFLIHITATEFAENGEPINGKGFKNCEVFEYSFK
jgi:bisphosphoglycerate-dependent phosphoglycerate mutase